MSDPYQKLIRLCLSILVGLALALNLTACGTTRQARSVTESGFLGDYSMLKPGRRDEAKLLYIAEGVNWRNYSQVYIEPIQLWRGDASDSPLGELSREHQQMLVNFFHTSLNNELQKYYVMVDQPGPGTIVVRAAITEARKSRPVSNLMSTVVPFGIAANVLATVVFGKGLSVGDAQVEAVFLDGGTNRKLAAAVDRRVGTKTLRSKFDGSFGDVKQAMDYWSRQLAVRLKEGR
jgi:urease gamma subunit